MVVTRESRFLGAGGERLRAPGPEPATGAHGRRVAGLPASTRGSPASGSALGIASISARV
ncbi:hypothetical protein ACFSVJ_06455 [Prauserella oleivorans]